jgi:hypothetical protein
VHSQQTCRARHVSSYDAGTQRAGYRRFKILRWLNLGALAARRKSMRGFYAVLFALFVVAMGALEVVSSRATARIADYPDPPSVFAPPTLPAR